MYTRQSLKTEKYILLSHSGEIPGQNHQSDRQSKYEDLHKDKDEKHIKTG